MSQVLQKLGNGGPGGATAAQWFPLTQAMLEGAGAADVAGSMKSWSVVNGRLTVVFNAVGATTDGIREAGGRSVPILDIAPEIDFNEHDLLIWLGNPSAPNATACIGIAVCNAPGAGADGVGVYAGESRGGGQGISSVASSSVLAGLDSVHARFSFSGPDAGGSVSATVFVQHDGTGVGYARALGNGASDVDAVNLSDPANVKLFFEALSYTGAQTEDTTVSADVYFAVVPRVTPPP